MAANNNKILSRLLLILVIIASGCDAATTSPTLSPETESPTSELPTPSALSNTQAPAPTQLPTNTLTATPTLTPTITVSPTPSNPALLGLSTGGYPIEVYRYGSGPIPVIFVGGIHGGYEWNTILLAYELIDYFSATPDVLYPQLTIYILPAANPDGQVKVVGSPGRFSASEVKGNTLEGRFNNNGVDLNRNWDCEWSPEAVWRNNKLNPGNEPFSEVESRLLRDFILEVNPAAVIFWHSAYPAVFPGGCANIHEASRSLAQIYANSAGYPSLDSFTSYEVTGDSTNWLALQNIPSIEVELNNHTDTDFDQNLKGVLSVLDFVASQPLPSPASTEPTK